MDTYSWNPSSCKTWTYRLYIVNIIGADQCSGNAMIQGISNQDIDIVKTS